MNYQEVERNLKRIFEEEKARIVFWNDPQEEFRNDLHFVIANLGGVTVKILEEESALELKYLLEIEDLRGQYLLYSGKGVPERPEEDWLLDIRLYSRSFRADRSVLQLHELGLATASLDGHLALRNKFLGSKERFRKLKELIDPQDDAAMVDQKMLAVAMDCTDWKFFTVLGALFTCMAEQSGEESRAKILAQIEEFELDGILWTLAKEEFGYETESPSLKGLLVQLLVSEFCDDLKGDCPEGLRHLRLPEKKMNNVHAFLSGWRDSRSQSRAFDALSEEVSEELNIEALVSGKDVQSLEDVKTFLIVEKALLCALRDEMLEQYASLDEERILDIINNRRAGYWASPGDGGRGRMSQSNIHHAYAVLEEALRFFSFYRQYADGFVVESAEELFFLYKDELFQVDQSYRRIYTDARKIKRQGWDLLKNLCALVGRLYSEWYLTKLGLEWDRWLEGGLLARWQLKDVPLQRDFFKDHIQDRVEFSTKRKSFVIISDALRYEAAEALTEKLQGQYRMKATLEAQLGVLPSRTASGMACLLPHETLSHDRKGAVLVDGKKAATLAQRNSILKGCPGIALNAEEVMAVSREESRERVRDTLVVYIYHNTIDALGDAASTEEMSFEAVDQAIEELVDLVRFIFNTLNGNHVVITADHGFLYTEEQPSEVERSLVSSVPEDVLLKKKRYILGSTLQENDKVHRGNTKTTLGSSDELFCWMPKGVSLFHFAGGARFVHGGAMLQEVVLPVITVKIVKEAGEKAKTRVRPVELAVLGLNHRITTEKHRFQILQTEAVSERIRAVAVKVAVYDGEEPVTNIETLIFDSTSDSVSDRQKEVWLLLKQQPYDKTKTYKLSVRDAESGVELNHADVTIDRLISDDF